MRQEQASAAPRRRSQAEAEQLAADFEASGLRRREFCRSRGLNVSTLDVYRKRLRQARGEGAGADRWVAVQVSGPKQSATGGLTVVLEKGRRIEVGRKFDAGTLEQLLHLLERN